MEEGANEDLDVLNHNDSSDYLSGASDYEDTDGEPYTDGEAYTDNEDLEEPTQQEPMWRRSSALARSSEPARQQAPSPEPEIYYEEGEEAEPEYTVPPQAVSHIRNTYKSQASSLENEASPATHSFTDSDIEPEPPLTPSSDGPPVFRAPDPTALPSTSPPPVTLSAIEHKLEQVSHLYMFYFMFNFVK